MMEPDLIRELLLQGVKLHITATRDLCRNPSVFHTTMIFDERREQVHYTHLGYNYERWLPLEESVSWIHQHADSIEIGRQDER